MTKIILGYLAIRLDFNHGILLSKTAFTSVVHIACWDALATVLI